MTQTITPVLLCGGVGTRLWPLSRQSYPKQFALETGGHSLFQASALRVASAEFAPPLVITASDFRFIVTSQLAGVGLDPGPILIEPEARNTAPAVLAAALYLAARDPGAVLLLLPSDHVIPDSQAFRAAVRQGLAAVAQGQIVTFGIAPDRPETGYGYLEPERPAGAGLPPAPPGGESDGPGRDGQHKTASGDAAAQGEGALLPGALPSGAVSPDQTSAGPLPSGPMVTGPALTGPLPTGPLPLRRFIEKPDALRAQQMLDQGHYLWNAGIFLARACDLIGAFRQHAPAMSAPVQAALDQAVPDLGFLRLAPGPWSQLEAISVDYAVMEKAANLAVVPFRGGWSDLGGWDAVWREGGPDAKGVVTSAHATAIDCENTLLRSEADTLELVGIGLSDIIAIAMPDAVLVARADRAQDVRQAVAALTARGARQAAALPRVHRPWGWYDSLAEGARFQVKCIHVHPGGALSLQSHMHRSEHWIVVQGTARVTIGDQVQLVAENQSTYIPLGVTHRLENPGKLPMVLIEVQTGSYFGEDDIIRYDDVYARGAQG